MHGPTIYELADENANMTDVQRLTTIYWTLSQVLMFGVPGDVVELGCNAGLTSVYLQMLIDEFDPSRTLHVYDSFAGLPACGPEDRYLHQVSWPFRSGPSRPTSGGGSSGSR